MSKKRKSARYNIIADKLMAKRSLEKKTIVCPVASLLGTFYAENYDDVHLFML